MLNPKESIDFAAAGGGNLLGGCAGAFSSSTRLFLLAGLEGIRGGPLGLGGILGVKSRSTGLGGIFGAKSRSTTGGCRIGTVGADLTLTRGTFAALASLAFSSSSRLVGGRGGSSVLPKAGGSFLCVSTDEVLVTEDPAWLNDIPDTVELNDTVDSFDPLRTSCVDAFRGGKAGDGCEALRPGSGGGSLRAGRGGVFTVFCGWSLSTGGGGRSCLTLIG